MLGDFNELGFGLSGVFDSVIWMTTKCFGFLVVYMFGSSRWFYWPRDNENHRGG